MLHDEGLQIEGLPLYKHIQRNEFSYRKQAKQKEEDIAICDCQINPNRQDSACGEHCLNVLTSTECTPGYCPCGDYCMNQRFQKCQYAKSTLFKTEGRGWGLLADEDIKAGQFVIEYCGEVISWKEAKQRSQAYEAEGLKDAYIISLNGHETIDATRKGNLARFINHSCGPNCETRKWNVLGEIRVGIFAKQDISTGTELSYNYNFEWYGGTKVRCLCGAACCSDFLGAKSRGFQEATYLWEDDDNRYSVDNMPLYDSTDEETDSNFLKAIVLSNEGTTSETETGEFLRRAYDTDCMMLSQALPINVEPLCSVPMEVDEGKNEANEQDNFYVQHALQNPGQKSTVVSHIRSKNVFRSYQIQSGPLFKSSPHYSNGKSKNYVRRQVNVKFVCERLASKEACDELLSCEELKNQATSQLDRVYDEIRPAIEERERDSQDSVPTSVAEKWIEASCNKLKAEFDLHSSIIKSILCTPHRSCAQANPHEELDLENGIKFLENGQ
ncbi:histone-lysine N-methyltransferase ASHH1 [Phalaenopsis equestris]|uniref:histone-lysine N-methyltransferase ASHH1 n=1 Tax=Phalaenopsis equestris TaxID=78828 RepID=UPI0009E5EC43|nr:histone-lysine N-methyltransferase ASHH1 [Phalaenopsis equestris]